MIAIIVELGFLTADTIPALLTFGGMYFNHDGGICKHFYIIDTSVLIFRIVLIDFLLSICDSLSL